MSLLALALLGALVASDFDFDGLPDAMEDWLDSYAFTSDDTDDDVDNDGLLDGFEYALAGRPDSTLAPADIVPAVRIACYREPASAFVNVIALTVGDPEAWDKFGVFKADDPTEEPIELTGMLERVITSGSDELHTFRASIRFADVVAAGSDGIALAVIGEPSGGSLMWSSGTLLALDGDPWFNRYEGGMDPYDQGTGVLEPCDAWSHFVAPGSDPDVATTGTGSGGGAVTRDQVCGTVDRREPTGTPGLLRSVVLTAGCSGGEWACPAGVCTMSGSVAMDKLVIDVMLIGGSGGS